MLFSPEHPDEAAKAKGAGGEAEHGDDDEGEEEESGVPGWVKLLNPNSLTVCKGESDRYFL